MKRLVWLAATLLSCSIAQAETKITPLMQTDLVDMPGK
jgi:hypothetical protein